MAKGGLPHPVFALAFRVLVVASTFLILGLVPLSASADTITDPEIDLVTGTLPAANPGTVNLSQLLSNGFSIPGLPPGPSALHVVNDLGHDVGTLTITLVGSAAASDASGVLTCSVTNASSDGYTGCSATSGAGTGNPLSNPGQPPWAWTFTGGTITAGETFDLHFGSFNAADSLTTAAAPEPASLVLFGSGLVALGAVARRRFKGIRS